MARTRNLKPGFFKNEMLAECTPLARILFAGLWTIADREGRLEDRPKRIKADLLPYDECDIEALLNSLADRDFITRYAAENNKYIQIVKFVEHQNPHQKEAASTIPAPDKSGASPVLEPCDTETSTDNSGTSHALNLNPSPESLKPSVVVTAREPFDVFAHGEILASIVGWDQSPNWMGDYSRLQIWHDGGWDFELDIKPTVVRLMKQWWDNPARKVGQIPSSLKYFEKAIADTHAQRMAPLPKGEAGRAPAAKPAKQDYFDGIVQGSREVLEERERRKARGTEL